MMWAVCKSLIKIKSVTIWSGEGLGLGLRIVMRDPVLQALFLLISACHFNRTTIRDIAQFLYLLGPPSFGPSSVVQMRSCAVPVDPNFWHQLNEPIKGKPLTKQNASFALFYKSLNQLSTVGHNKCQFGPATICKSISLTQRQWIGDARWGTALYCGFKNYH